MTTHHTAPSCACDRCVKLCQESPGWFLPGEAEAAAALLNMPFPEFLERHLIIDYWVGGASLYAPRKQGIEIGRERASWGYAFEKAPCSFLTPENRCQIHDAKPAECRANFGCHETKHLGREAIQQAWLDAGAPPGADSEGVYGEEDDSAPIREN